MRPIGGDPDVAQTSRRDHLDMTIVWFLIWFVANTIGDAEPLTFDPVNVWAGTLVLAVALDLGRQHASGLQRPNA